MACDYLEKYRFKVEIAPYTLNLTTKEYSGIPSSHIDIGYFKSVTGISKDIEVKEFKLNTVGGSSMNRHRKFPGFTRPGIVTFERAIYGLESKATSITYPTGTVELSKDDLDYALYLRNWYYKVNDPESGIGSLDYKRQVLIYINNREGDPSRLVTLNNAWPIKYTFPDLDATNSDVGYELLQLRCSEIEYVDAP
jgi:phage tail-like protein